MPTWYRTGTISVTSGSATVTGSGTAWIAAVQSGDALHGPDGRVYEVTSVDSNTSLTLATNYAGTSLSGQSYAIQPTRGILQDFQATVTAWLAAQAGYVDGPLAGKWPDGAAATPALAFSADLDTGLFRPGANRLGIAAGGVGQVEVNATDGLLIGGSLAYRRANILGTVSQSGGVPTGGVIERGSNANGEYVRFADGTQLCWIKRTVNVTTSAVGSVHRSTADFGAWTWPASFLVAAGGIIGGANVQAADCWAQMGAVSSTQAAAVVVYAPTALTAESKDISAWAMGRWF